MAKTSDTDSECPPAIDQFQDGRLYRFSQVAFKRSNLYLKIERIGSLFLKAPTDRGHSCHRNYIWRNIDGPNAIRRAEGLEAPFNIDVAIEKFPEFDVGKSVGPDVISIYPAEEWRRLSHYLLIHKLSLLRLKALSLPAIPEARFAYLQTSRIRLFGLLTPALSISPVIIQEAVNGTSLWDMYDATRDVIFAEYQQYRHSISEQISYIIDSDKAKYYDWNPMNFILQKNTLYYIDSKPTTFAGRRENEHNLNRFREVFVFSHV